MTYGTRLLHLRQKSGLTQTQMAENLNIAVSTYNSWEADKSCYRIDMADKLAELFGIDPGDLLKHTTSNPAPPSPPVVAQLYAVIDSQKKTILLQEAEIERLHHENRRLQG